MNRRVFITGGAALAGSGVMALEEKTVDGGLAPVSWADRVAKSVPVLPPGAHSLGRFLKRCIGCGRCTAACPSQCLRPSESPRRLGSVELDFRHGWCRRGCTRCGEVCPTGAIEKVPYDGKHLIRVGRATVDAAKCLRQSEGVECHACEKHCPVRAITVVKGIPVVDEVRCTGCGACEHYCPVRPVTAIRVAGYETHREIRPISEGDLLAEMRVQLEGGKAFVVARDGVIIASGVGRGVKPLLDMLETAGDKLAGSVVMDRVCGRASAAICIVAKVRLVASPVMAEGAKKLLEANGVAAVAGKVVPEIRNRSNDGTCPMDRLAAGTDSPREIVNRICEAVRKGDIQ